MNDSINSLLGWSERSLPQQKLCSISDTLHADGSFVLVHFISLFAKANQRICFVGLEQTFIHYFTVLRKFGINIKNIASAGKFSFINGLANPYEWTEDVFSESTNPAIAALQSISSAHPFRFDSLGPEPLKRLFDIINRQIDAADSAGESICVLIDCVNYIFDAAHSNHALDFIQAVKSRVEFASKPSTFVFLLHSDAFDSACFRNLLHLSDVSFVFSGFRTGSFRDVDGQVQVVSRGSSVQAPSFVYKVTENTIKLDLIRKETI